MAENSKIEWTTHTFNPWIGCTKVGPGCDHCYAEDMMARRYGRVQWGAGHARSRTSPANWRKPVAWNRAAEGGPRPRVFCASLADVFDNEVPPQWRTDLFRLIYETPNLDWLLLTKRIGNVTKALTVLGDDELPPNVWLGATVVNQQEADRDIPKLVEAPARVRFLSCEPLLGPIEHSLRGVDWVIAGGESGRNARPMDEDWCFWLAYRCSELGIPFFMKQGSAANWQRYKDFESFPETLQVRQFPSRVC